MVGTARARSIGVRFTIPLVFVALTGLLSACTAQQQEPSSSEPSPNPTTESQPQEAPPTTGAGEVEGKLGGDSFTVYDARLFAGRLSERDATRRGVRIVLAAQADACGHPDMARPGHRTLSFDIGARDKSSGDDAINVGTYSVPAALAADATSVFARLDARTASCNSESVVATDGTVTIDEATATRIRGTFDLKMGKERVRGHFDAPACPTSPSPVLTTRCEP